MYPALSGMIRMMVVILLLAGTVCSLRVAKRRKVKTSSGAICNCELQMTHGWTRELLLSIFKRPIAAWGPGKSPCARMREGCKILCNIMGRKYLEGRGINSKSQGTILGQRLCELHSHRNGYRPLKAPGQIVTVNYKLDKCWKKNFGYAVAFKVDGNLCCKSVTPFKEYPFVRLYVWNKDCVDSQIYLYGK